MNGIVSEAMDHQDDEPCQQHQEHETDHFKNGMDEHHAVGEDGGEYDSAHRGEQGQEDFGKPLSNLFHIRSRS